MRITQAGLTALLVAAGSLPVAAARGQEQSGDYSYKRPSPTTITNFQSLYDLCADSAQGGLARSEHALCVGYFTGVIDFYLSETRPAQRKICLPTDPPQTRQEARDKLVAWAAANPAAFAQPAAVGVYQFLLASFPCAAAAP